MVPGATTFRHLEKWNAKTISVQPDLHSKGGFRCWLISTSQFPFASRFQTA